MADRFATDRLVFERILHAPRETVWRYLIDPDLRARWFMAGPTDARVGGRLGLTMAHDNLSDEAVPFPEKYAPYQGNSWSEEITALDPPRLLAFTWSEGKDGQVSIELEDLGERTRLTLTHSEIPRREGAINFGGGWGAHLDVLERRLRGEPVANFWTLHAAAEERARAALA